MAYVNASACNGCGDCLEICSAGALILQDTHAFIDQNLCQGCEACVDACPVGAILAGEPEPVARELIPLLSLGPESARGRLPVPGPTPLRERILPAIGAMLLWAGRELGPRLADLAMEALDRRILASQSAPAPNNTRRRLETLSRPVPGDGRGRRRRSRNKKRISHRLKSQRYERSV